MTNFTAMQKTILLLICFGFLGGALFGQVSLKDSSVNVNMLHITYRPLFPVGDMAEQYGILHSFGFEWSHKYASNWVIDAGINFIPDGDVKVSESFDVLSGLRINGGFVINDEGTPTIVRQRATGFLIPFSIGKVFPSIGGSNPNSGLYVKMGLQLLQHKIQFQVEEGPIASLREGRNKAYDLLTNGVGVREEIGYLYLSDNGYVNFSIGLDLSQSFTQNRRSFNALTGGPITDTRLDLIGGLRVSWIFLIYKKAPGIYYY